MDKKRSGKAKEIPLWQKEEADALAAIFNRKAEITQAEFGARYGIGTQGMVWQYLSGYRPLNISAATAFAAGLDVKIAEFSPRLEKEILRACPHISDEIAPRGWDKLADEERVAFQALIDSVLTGFVTLSNVKPQSRSQKGPAQGDEP